MRMNKFGKIALAAAITFGGIGATQLTSSKAFAASVSSNGFSINPIADTLNLSWHPEGAQVAVKDNNNIGAYLTVDLKDDKGNLISSQNVDLQAGEKKYLTFKTDWKEDGTQYHYEVEYFNIVSTSFTVTGSIPAPKTTTTTTNTTTNTTTTGYYGTIPNDSPLWGQPQPPTDDQIDNTSDTMCYLHCE